MSSQDYHDVVNAVESGMGGYAQKSFSAETPFFLNGVSILQHFQELWKTPAGQMKLANRTPLQLERDRILYSSGLRKQTEKYHVLYSGARRITRNYTTHTMRMAHVTRSICKTLRLNSDFAEAIALGSKVGAAPFIHVSKEVVGSWLQRRLMEISERAIKQNPSQKESNPQLPLFPKATPASTPKWLSGIESRQVVDEVARHVPCAVGEQLDSAYHSGAESYWILCTQPYLRESSRNSYHPETMYGIWRHSRGLRPKAESFFHKCNLYDNSTHTITWEHSTYEGLVVQFADDVTWIIENLNDANDAALLGGANTNLFLQLKNSIGDAPLELTQALVEADAGGLYTYFIADFIRNSQTVLTPAVGREICVGLRAGEQLALIGPSETAAHFLNSMQTFLFRNVFEVARIKNRNRMLKSVTEVSLDLLYDTQESALEQMVHDRANLENWPGDKRVQAISMLENVVHRAQLAVDVFVGMGDQEVFDFVGISQF